MDNYYYGDKYIIYSILRPLFSPPLFVVVTGGCDLCDLRQ